MFLPIDMVIESRHRPVAFIGRGDSAGLAERHGPVAVSRPAERADTHGQGVQVPFIPMSDAEEIPERDVDTGGLFPVVINPQPHQAGPGVLVVSHRHPDVIYDSRPAKIRHNQSLARHDAPAVVVTTDKRVVARYAMSREGLYAWKIGQTERDSGRLRGSDSRKKNDPPTGPNQSFRR